MKLEYTISNEDYIAFSLYHTEHSPAILKTRQHNRLSSTLMLMILCAVILFLMGMVFGNSAWEIALVTGVFVTLAGLIYYATFPAQCRWNYRRLLKRALAGGEYVEFTGPQTIELLEPFLLLTSPRGRSEVPWGEVERVVQHDQWLYVYLGSSVAVIIPLVAFADEGQQGAFVACLAERQSLVRERTQGTGRDREQEV